MNLFLGMTAVGAIGLVLCAMGYQLRPTPQTKVDITGDRAAAIVLGAVIVRLSMLLLMARNGFLIFTMDEAVRGSIASGWSRDPFWFTQWDGIWLSGGFAYFGLLMKLLGGEVLGVQLGALLGSFLTISGAYFLACTLTGRRWIGAAAALLIAPGFPFLWFGHGPLVEGLIGGLFLFSFAFCWRFAASDRDRPRQQWGYAIAAGTALFLATSMHYTAWMAIFLGVPFFVVAVWRRREALGPAGLPAGTFVLFSAAIFPVIWMLGSWHYLGHPLTFLRNQSGTMAYYMDVLGRSDAGLSKFIVYFKELWNEAGPLLPATIGLGVVALWARTKLLGGRILGLYLIGLLLLMSSLAVSTGYGVPSRSLIIVYSLVVVLTAVLFETFSNLVFFPGSKRNVLRLSALLSLCAMAMGWLGFNGLMANRYELYSGSEAPHDTLVLGLWLQQEMRNSQQMRPLAPTSSIGFYTDENLGEWIALIGYLGSCHSRLVPLSADQWTNFQFDSLAYLISSDDRVPEGFGLLTQIGRWRIHSRL